MRQVKSSGTSIEKRAEQLIKELDLDYEFQPKLYGHPDFRIVGTKILIFCDGSFWHGRNKSDLNGESFGRNAKFWKEKINYNLKRDSKINRTLKKEGWIILRFWDTEINKKQEYVKSKIIEEVLDARK